MSTLFTALSCRFASYCILCQRQGWWNDVRDIAYLGPPVPLCRFVSLFCRVAGVPAYQNDTYRDCVTCLYACHTVLLVCPCFSHCYCPVLLASVSFSTGCPSCGLFLASWAWWHLRATLRHMTFRSLYTCSHCSPFGSQTNASLHLNLWCVSVLSLYIYLPYHCTYYSPAYYTYTANSIR